VTESVTYSTYISSYNGDAGNVAGNGYTLYVNGVALEGVK
jgi:hypothetical protein